jgi:hypothetical protein
MRRTGTIYSFAYIVYLFFVGCQPVSTPQGGALSAGPYPESRAIIEWIRIQTDDPEAYVERWGPRQEQKETSQQHNSVVIEIHYQATIGNVLDGHWKQSVRVMGKQIREETPRSAE